MSGPAWRPLSEGWALVLPLLALGLLAARVFPRLAPLPVLLAAAAALTLRDPERVVTRQAQVALAPADGRVVHVDRVWDDYWQAELVEIGIFLAIWDVHVQRCPLDGEVVAQRHRPGGYGPAMFRQATERNNQLATYLRTSAGPCVITQISGLVARRIVTWAGPGTRLAQGDRLGMIKLGSQTTLRLPASSTVLVQVGDHVHAGLTPVARVEGEKE